MRSALRSLWRRPAFSAAAILTVALGIGANTALFSVIYSVLFRPLPFRDPEKLVEIWQTHPTLPQLQVTVPDFEDWRVQTHSFDQVAAYTLAAMNNTTLLGEGEPAAVHATMASANLFPAMGIEPLAGRAFNESEDLDREHVALISEKLWRRKFGADPSVIGRQIRLQTDSFRVLGVIPQRQAFPEWADLWIPLSLIESDLKTRRKYHPLEVMARLKRGVSVEQAQSEIQGLARRTAQAHPDTNGTIGAYVIPLSRELTKAVRPGLLMAWAAVGLVLLIACANLAHLFLARMIERRQEMAIREALGAKPRHLVRQILSESLLVAVLGGAAGFGFAIWGGQLLGEIAAAHIPRLESPLFEAPVWLFGAILSLFAAMLFGLPACWHAMRSRRRLSITGRSVTRGHGRVSALLMTAEIAMALLVLSGAALLTRNFAALLDENPGFVADDVWEIPNLPLRSDWDKAASFLDSQLAPALRNVPGVIDVAAVNSAPMTLGPTEHTRFATRFSIEGRTFDPGSYPVAQNRWGTPGYFRLLGVPLRQGRWLTESDLGKPRILVNETLARRFFPNQDPVGKRIVLGVMDPQQQLNEIVGVVGDTRDLGLDQEVEPTLYGIGTGPVMTVLVKAKASSHQIGADLRAAIHRADPEIAVTEVRPLQQNLDDSLARRRFALLLLSIFGAMAAFLTAGGIYGLLSQAVNARVREFGVRAAVGASPRELVGMILREALALSLPGLVCGALLSLVFAGVMKSLVDRVSPVDPVSIASAGALLLVLTIFSAWLPARRAAAVDPATALRSE